MDPINQLFNFVERYEHAPVNLHPYFALAFIEMGIMAAFLHAVYCGNNFYAHVSLRYLPLEGPLAEALPYRGKFCDFMNICVLQIPGASIQLNGRIRRSLAPDAFPCQPHLVWGHD